MEPSDAGERELSRSDRVLTNLEIYNMLDFFLPKMYAGTLGSWLNGQNIQTTSNKRNVTGLDDGEMPSTSKRMCQKQDIFKALLKSSGRTVLGTCPKGSEFAELLCEDQESRLKNLDAKRHLSKERGYKVELTPIQIVDRRMAFSKEVKQESLSQEFGLLRNLTRSSGIDSNIFSVENLTSSEKNPRRSSTLIETREQTFQGTKINKLPNGQSTWKFTSIPGEMSLSDYGKYFIESSDFIGDKKKTIIFGTNLDLLDGDADWDEQLNELAKLPEWLQPTSRNSYIASQYTQLSIPGVNEVQAYIKVAGSRTPGHQEHGNSTSVNINFGPGISKWYGTRRVDFHKLKEILKKNRLNFSNDPWWPNTEDLIKYGIPYFEFDQLQGDAVVVNVGAPHWVECSTKCVNAAWNVAPFTPFQLEGFLERSRQDQEDGFQTLLPMNNIIRNLLRSLDVVGEAKMKFKKLLLIIAAGIIARIRAQMDLISHTRIHENTISFQKSPAAQFQPSVCSKCSKEIVYHVLLKRSKKRNLNQRNVKLFCIDCGMKMDKMLRSFEYKTDFDIEEFLKSYDQFRRSLQ